ncbi:MAG TPA: type 2 isopentenyl-diphosphate Delta-isomerase [Candidatus Methanofastidiosa archaeon]|nr:type 2 isopentenyl-diphosphate Delta-isomerase [Candidatus Methanofastidiosa archaeon]
MESGDIGRDGKITQRKDDHIRHAMENDVQCNVPAGFDDVMLIHNSLPEVDFDEIDTRTRMFGKVMDHPFLISAITGGSKLAGKINRELALKADKYNIGISVGSQRAMFVDRSLKDTYEIRKYAPDVPLFSNLGLAQVIGMKNDEVSEQMDSIGADVLAVHLNPLQEILQPEGDTSFKGGLERLRELKKDLGKPVIVKETGAGISKEVARTLSFLDGAEVSGVGGTSFAAVEYYRAESDHHRDNARLFWDWGIPTVCSLVESGPFFDNVIASGGVRNGMHVVKSLVLGATCAGLAQPFLEAVYNRPSKESDPIFEKLIHEIRTTMFLVGARDVGELKERPVVFLGSTKEYLEQRGVDLSGFAQRGF